MHLTIYLQAMRTSYELATKIYTLHSGRRSLHNQISPMSSMMKLQRLCSLSSSTYYPESFVKQFASRHFSPPELPLKVRTLFQVAVSAFSMRWKLGQQSLISRLQSSERTDHWQVLAVSPGPIRFFVIILCFHRLFFSDKRTYIHLPSSPLMHLSSYICRHTREGLY